MTEYKTPQSGKSLSPAPNVPTAPDLSYMGLGEIAYVRAVVTSGAKVWEQNSVVVQMECSGVPSQNVLKELHCGCPLRNAFERCVDIRPAPILW